MRQAGRYLPEYRQVRAEAGGFVELCLDPVRAARVTLQPVERFGLDAAIVFSDILIVPYALGVPLWFEEGDGPRLEPVRNREGLGRLRGGLDQEVVGRVYEVVRRVRSSLGAQVAVIGFAGAPWTVATYVIAGQGGDDQLAAKELMRRDGAAFADLIDRLAEATASHLIGQLEAGADVVQIFDTWAGNLDAAEFDQWCVRPTARIVAAVRAARPKARVIVFPKEVDLDGIVRLAGACAADCVSLSGNVSRTAARTRLGGGCALQGNLGPETLLAGGRELDEEIGRILEDFAGTRHVFNLAHGILKDTPIGHVEQMIERVRRGT
jgi:uroporphyrinogen decarboxylase